MSDSDLVLPACVLLAKISARRVAGLPPALAILEQALLEYLEGADLDVPAVDFYRHEEEAR